MPVETYPLVTIIVGALSGMTYMSWRAIKSPDIILNKKDNPQPWQHVSQDENTRLFDGSATFFKRKYVRKEW
jgi:NADH dehydrogenase (ubiquinone) 1 alpha subcomplex subunit 4